MHAEAEPLRRNLGRPTRRSAGSNGSSCDPTGAGQLRGGSSLPTRRATVNRFIPNPRYVRLRKPVRNQRPHLSSDLLRASRSRFSTSRASKPRRTRRRRREWRTFACRSRCSIWLRASRGSTVRARQRALQQRGKVSPFLSIALQELLYAVGMEPSGPERPLDWRRPGWRARPHPRRFIAGAGFGPISELEVPVNARLAIAGRAVCDLIRPRARGRLPARGPRPGVS